MNRAVVRAARGLSRRWCAVVLCAAACAGAWSCGRKGPPLAPLVKLPGVALDVRARRLGSQVVLQFNVPLANTDNTRPADLDRMEVYAHTGPLPAPQDYLRYGTLVGNIAVASLAPAPGGDQLPGVAQGSRASVSELITDAMLQPGKMPEVRQAVVVRADPSRPTVYTDLETEGTVNAPSPVMRYYVIVGVSHRNRRGAFSAPLGVPLVSPPTPATAVQAKYDEDAITLSWTAASRSDDPFAPPPAYNIYEVAESPAVTASEQPATFVALPPINTVLDKTTDYKDPRIEFGTRRCYQVRAVRLASSVPVESEPSDPVCILPVDTFPPAAPKALAAVASGNAIDLIWEPNTEKDLAGYVVLRGEAPGETLMPLTPAPIRETTYRDASAQPGVAYVYAVVAVDSAPKPNTSAYSNKVTESIK